MKDSYRILLVIGTRPEAIKMAPVYEAVKKRNGLIPLVLATGQHREQFLQALEPFDVEITQNMDLMTERQTLSSLAGSMLQKASGAYRKLDADFVLVHGDTLTTFVMAWAAFMEGIPAGHVEAGLRSFDMKEPFPEEANRRLTDVLTELDFAPTPPAKEQLLKEGKDPEHVFCTGQTGVDAILRASETGTFPEGIPHDNLVTVTLHRRENWPVLRELAISLKRLAAEYKSYNFIYPVHLNPAVREAVVPVLKDTGNFYLLDPLGYGQMAKLLSESRLILTDSGGLQEEGAALGVPVGVVRNVTERPEGIETGILTILSNDPDKMLSGAKRLLENAEKGNREYVNPYGDGRASERIAEALAWKFGLGEKPGDWIPQRCCNENITKRK